MESMIYQYRARYYDAAWGRFLSRDPVVYLPSACGLYGYTSINPIRFLDPSGNYITVHVHVSTAATLDESAEKMRFFEDVRQALQSIVGDCATITLKDKKSVLLGNAGPMPVYAKIGFKYEKPNCKNDECWQELKKAIESDSELPVHWQKKTDRPYWRPQDDVSWIKGFFGTTWGTHINYYDKIPLWEIEPNGKYTARNAPFSVMLWHELIGHGHLGLKHPKTSENVINLDTPTGFYDETIQCENRARRCLGLLERFHQYIQPKERYVPVHGTTWEPE